MSDANVDPGVAGAASDPAGAVPASPQAGETGKPEAVYAPDHPHASPRSGYIPPVATRFDGTPGPGRPKGSHSARAALQRKWRKGWEQDSEAGDGEEQLGLEARRVADEAHDAALAGDGEKVRALTALIDQVEGKPQERVENTGALTVKRIDLEGAA